LADHVAEKVFANLRRHTAVRCHINKLHFTADNPTIAAMTRPVMAMEFKAMVRDYVNELLESAV
jgi:hypothetical protein